MVKVLRVAARYPFIAQITTRRSHPVLINGRYRIVHNTNQLVGGSQWQVLLSKTGFTNEAGRCLGMRAQADGRTVIVVLIGAARRSGIMRDAMAIRRWLASNQIAAAAHSSGQGQPLVAASSRATAPELDRRRSDDGLGETAAVVDEPSIARPGEGGTTENAAEPNTDG